MAFRAFCSEANRAVNVVQGFPSESVAAESSSTMYSIFSSMMGFSPPPSVLPERTRAVKVTVVLGGMSQKAVQFFRVHQVPEAITPLAYTSLAELYQHYVREYVQVSPIIASCGCQIHCYEHHFVHMVKLCDPAQPEFFFPDAKPRILETTVGFGAYEHDQLRARWLLAALETLKRPDMVIRTADLATSDRAFIKQFVHSQYPYLVVLVGKDDGTLTLRTAFPIRKGRLKRWTGGDILFPKTPQPPVGVAV